MKKSREELIEDFLSDIEVFDFESSAVTTPHEVRTLEIDVLKKDGKRVLNIDFDKPKLVSVYQLDISSRDDLDQYSWLFSRVSELLFLLEKVKNEKTH